MLYFAGFNEHYSLFTASRTFFAELGDELRVHDPRKGTIHFSRTKPFPGQLISRIEKLRRDYHMKFLLGPRRSYQ